MSPDAEFRATPFWRPALCELARTGEYARLMQYLKSPEFNVYSTAIEAISCCPDATAHFLPTIGEKLQQLCEQVTDEDVGGPIWASTFVIAARNMSVAQAETLIAPWIEGTGDVPVAILDIAHRGVAKSPLYPRLVFKAIRSRNQVRQYCGLLASVEDRGREVMHDLPNSLKSKSRVLTVAWQAAQANSDSECYETIARQIIMNPEFHGHPTIVSETAVWVPTVVALFFKDLLNYYWQASSSHDGVVGLATALGQAVHANPEFLPLVEGRVCAAQSLDEIDRAVILLRSCRVITSRVCSKLLQWYERANPSVRFGIHLLAGIAAIREQPCPQGPP